MDDRPALACLTLADSHEQAQYAASVLDVRYERSPSTTTIDEGRDAAFKPEKLFGTWCR